MSGRAVLHVDFDYFYAQCEELRRPELRGAPVVVCVFSSRGSDSGAVATANYEARAHGARSGMPIKLARSKLAGVEAHFLPVDFDHYDKTSSEAMELMRPHADVFEYVGRDEAYLDVTARTGGLLSRAAEAARRLQSGMRERTGLSCSVGVSSNRLLSKIASGHRKPGGLTVVEPQEAKGFLAGLDVSRLHGVGPATRERLSEMGLQSVSDIQESDVFDLFRAFGRKTGAYIHNAANGTDATPVRERAPSVQYSKIVTLGSDSSEYAQMEGPLGGVCAQLHKKTAEKRVMFRSVGIQVILSDLSSMTRSQTLRSPTGSLERLEKCARQLLRAALPAARLPVRRLGVRVSELTPSSGQSDLADYF